MVTVGKKEKTALPDGLLGELHVRYGRYPSTSDSVPISSGKVPAKVHHPT